MQRIILCPKCHVHVKKDDLGELLCPSCNARLCPKAHILDGKICPYCGWEDPNYYLWQRTTRKVRAQSSIAKESDESLSSKPKYVCPQCGIEVDPTLGRCPHCGLLHTRKRLVMQKPAVSTTPAPVSKPPDTTAIPAKSAHPAPSRASAPPSSPILHEIAKAERREWKFPPLMRFVRPVLASLLVCAVLAGLAMGGIYVTRLVSQSTEPGTQPPPPPLTPSKTYTLSTQVVPETGGEIRIVSPSSSSGAFEPGSQITLTAIPGDCYTFSYWDGASGSSETVTVNMDSDKTVAAHFTLKDTTPPTISEVKATAYSDVSATITWETDKPATSQVEYGETKDYGLSTTFHSELTTSHKVRLTALEPNKTYYFMVKSADKCGNEATKTEKLTTPHKISVGDKVGNRAPSFTLSSYQDDNPESPHKGQTVSLSDFQGKKVLLNFWNTFCGACLGEFPYIRAIYEDERWANKNQNSDFVVITICIDGRADRIGKLEDKYLDETGPFTFPILLDTEENSAGDSYNVWKIPKTVFIDSDGIIREIKWERFNSKEEIEVILKSLE